MTNTPTIETLQEAVALLKALTPKQAPEDVNTILGATGLRIVKNEHMPDDTIAVSKNLFDLIFEASEKSGNG